MPKKKEDVSNEPWISNYPPLDEWLKKHGARCMWQLANPPHDADDENMVQSYVECWLVNRRVVIIQVHNNRMGWEIYSALNTVDINETLADVEDRVELK